MAGTILAAPAVLAACGQTARPAPGGVSAGAQPAPLATRFPRPVQLTYWKSLEGPRHDAQVKLTDDFNAGRDDVKVTLEHVGAYEQAAEKLGVALASGTPPDVMLLTVDSHMPAFARLGALHPLDEFARSDKGAQVEKYYPTFIQNGQVGGRQYQIPFARSTPLLYFNRDLLRAAGLPETAPGTWDEVLASSQRIGRAGSLTAPDGTVSAPYPAASDWWIFQTMLWTFGGSYSDPQFAVKIDGPEAVQAGQFLVDLVHRHRAADASKNGQNEFLQGKRAFLAASTANLTQIETGASFRVGAAFMPGQKVRAVPGGGSGLSLLQATAREKKEAGWEFIKTVTNTAATVYFSQATGYMPVRSDAMEHPEMRAFLEAHPNARVTIDQLQYVRTNDAIIGTPLASVKVQAALTRVLFEQANVRQTLDDLARDLRMNAQEARTR
jgi:sn-glycerol 3-phosphate transport system substrate-binding protein